MKTILIYKTLSKQAKQTTPCYYTKQHISFGHLVPVLICFFGSWGLGSYGELEKLGLVSVLFFGFRFGLGKKIMKRLISEITRNLIQFKFGSAQVTNAYNQYLYILKHKSLGQQISDTWHAFYNLKKNPNIKKKKY